MYDNHWWFWGYYNVKGIMIDLTPSKVYTNMHQTSKDTFVPLNDVSTKLHLYNGGTTVQGPGYYGTTWNTSTGVLTSTTDWGLAAYSPFNEAGIEAYMGINPRSVDKMKPFGWFYYENNGDNVTEFDVIIPTTIYYEWGSLQYNVRWHVDTTHGR